ncbi:hypothetical protein L0F63_007437 [Massospora cicadina]|nr:hypothetical protein L0F63_007437 [Massospora cicadina]
MSTIPGSYIVKLKGHTQVPIEAHLAGVSGLMEAQTGASNHSKLVGRVNNLIGNMYHAEMPPTIVKLIQRMPEVEYVEQDSKVSGDWVQKNSTWGLERISKRGKVQYMPYGYNYHSEGDGVTVYVVDSGIMVDHPEFEGRAQFGARFEGENDLDESGHGTHCAGTIASKTYGVAKKANLVAVRVLDGESSGSTSGVIAGIAWAVKDRRGIKGNIISMSLGGSVSPALNDAVEAAISEGFVVVAAGGNNNRDACTKSPASAPNAITVAATDVNDYRASFSNYGKCIDIFAPGVEILSTWNDKKSKSISGTSMAAPHVAGLAATLLSKSPMPPLKLTQTILEMATKGAVQDPGQGSPNLLLYNNAFPKNSCRVSRIAPSI